MQQRASPGLSGIRIFIFEHGISDAAIAARRQSRPSDHLVTVCKTVLYARAGTDHFLDR
jgi:hypothetical protein